MSHPLSFIIQPLIDQYRHFSSQFEKIRSLEPVQRDLICNSDKIPIKQLDNTIEDNYLLTQLFPYRADLHVHLAENLFAKGNLYSLDAKKIMQKVVFEFEKDDNKKNPYHASFLGDAALCSDRDLLMALVGYQSAIESAHQKWEGSVPTFFYFKLGLVFYTLGDFNGAISLFNSVEQRKTADNPLLEIVDLYSLGIAQKEKGDLASATATFKDLIRRAESVSPFPHMDKILKDYYPEFRDQEGDFQKAKRLMGFDCVHFGLDKDDLLEVKESLEKVTDALQGMTWKKLSSDDIIKYWNRFKVVEGVLAYALYEYGKILEKQGNRSQALYYFTLALHKEPHVLEIAEAKRSLEEGNKIRRKPKRTNSL